jgi:hypothetical protein
VGSIRRKVESQFKPFVLFQVFLYNIHLCGVGICRSHRH